MIKKREKFLAMHEAISSRWKETAWLEKALRRELGGEEKALRRELGGEEVGGGG